MYFVQFPVSSTNIFPLANSHAGGELLSEFNLRSRETVATDPTIEYSVGYSFTHSMGDFEILSAADGADIPSTAIQIQPGRAIVNGHYVELLTPIVIDLAAVNYRAGVENVNQLKGDLAVGLVMEYSTYTTLAGTALVENEDGYYDGIRVVIVPETDMKRPIDSPTEAEYSQVNMHLLLGNFTFYGGTVSNVVQNSDKLKMLDASRIGDLSSSLSDIYVTKAGMDPHHLYVFADKRNSASDSQLDTWCQAEGSLMIWDNHPTLDKDNVHTASVAHFEYSPTVNLRGEITTGKTELVLPHKQIDGAKDQHGNDIFFADKRYQIPNATFSGTTGGVVSPEYTKRILHIEDMTNNFYRLPNGKMRAYVPILDAGRTNLPPIPVGDGSAEPIDVSVVFANIASALVDASQALGPSTTSGTALYILNSVLNTIGPDGIALDNVKGIVSSAKTKLDTGGDYAIAVNSANNKITSQDYVGAQSILTNLLTNSSNGFPATVNTLTQAISILTEVISHDNTNITALGNARNRVSDAIVSINTADELLHSATSAVENYIQTEVNKRADSILVLTSSVWSPGDYVLVGQDLSMSANTDGAYPSTMYVVNYGQVQTIRYVDSLTKVVDTTASDYNEQLDLVMHTVIPEVAGGVELASATLDSVGIPTVNVFGDYTQYKGAVNTDYFVARYSERDSDNKEYWYSYFFTPSSTLQQLTYIDPPITLSYGIGLATETTVGGFLSVPETQYGNGYVRIDENGNLRVVDYNYLVMGMNAQNLGEDLEIGSGLNIVAIQENIDQYVNDRICYPSDNQRMNLWDETTRTYKHDPHIIFLELTLPSVTEDSVIHIHDIGTRAGSYLHVKILGSATSATTIVFENCEKLRIDDTIQGNPNIILKNVNLYYSSNVLDHTGPYADYVSTDTGVQNLKLWYERDYENTDSADLQVDGMTVTLVGTLEDTMNYDPWDNNNPNDNHYSYALRSLTFAGDGSIIGVGLLVADSSTYNVDVAPSVFRSNFELPQNSGLSYPSSKLMHKLKVSGTFTTCYWASSYNKYIVKDTNFSALTSTVTDGGVGSIAFYTNPTLISHITGVADTNNIDCWDLGALHIFYGGAID